MLRCCNLKPTWAVAMVMLLGSGCVSAYAGPLKREPMPVYREHLISLQALVQGCKGDSAACDPAKTGEDERIDNGAATEMFQVQWRWLRDALQQAHAANAERRGQLMQEASTRLDEMVRENAQSADAEQAKDFAKARTDANRILNSAEFNDVEKETWWQREVAKFWLWVGRLFGGLAVLGDVAPWFGRFLEVLLFGGAAVGLLFFVRRSWQRQRLAVSLNTHASELAWARESTDWAAQAEGSARNGDWRDAVHSLYWATIVMLEGRRAWRHNPARTPREYVRLLKPGSAQQRALRGLTQIFERLWYGLREASSADYEKARALYESLRDTAAGDTAAGAA